MFETTKQTMILLIKLTITVIFLIKLSTTMIFLIKFSVVEVSLAFSDKPQHQLQSWTIKWAGWEFEELPNSEIVQFDLHMLQTSEPLNSSWTQCFNLSHNKAFEDTMVYTLIYQTFIPDPRYHKNCALWLVNARLVLVTTFQPFGVAPFLMFLGHILCWKTIIPIRLGSKSHSRIIHHIVSRKHLPNHTPVKWFCIPIMYPRDIPNIFGSFFYSIPLYIPTKESIYKTNRNVFWSNHHFSLYIKPPVLCLNRPMFDQCQSPVISRQRPNQRQGPEGSPRPMTGMPRYHSRVQNSFIFAEKSKLT